MVGYEEAQDSRGFCAFFVGDYFTLAVLVMLIKFLYLKDNARSYSRKNKELFEGNCVAEELLNKNSL